ncbi:MAG: hypothetical protein AAF208_05840 [Cyanobacteria bacterium P01_A01_bin.45]
MQSQGFCVIAIPINFRWVKRLNIHENQELGNSPPNPRLKDGRVPQTPSE